MIKNQSVRIECDMKKLFFNIILLLILLLLLLNPEITLKGAQNGLTLWYKAILPSLLPFMIISNFIVQYAFTDTISFIMRPITALLKLEKKAGDCIFAGLFFGYPACAATAVSMYKRGLINSTTANICISSFNNISPAFLSGYVCITILKSLKYMPLVFLIHYLTILINSLFVRYVIYNKCSENRIASSLSNDKHSDVPIISSIKNISKLGAYIMMFSIFSEYVQIFAGKFAPVICSISEITCGIQLLSKYIHNNILLLSVIMPFMAFGGLCGTFQTFCIDTLGITDKKRYIISRLSAVIISTFLSFILFII